MLPQKNAGQRNVRLHHWLCIRNELALKSRLRQPGRERPRWIGGDLGCAPLERGANQERSRRRNRSDAQVGFLFSTLMREPANHRPSRIMSSLAKLSGLRVDPENPNHHLWDNHGTWFLHYTIHPTPFTKERIRRSLGTKDVNIARERRDNFFATLANNGGANAPATQRKHAAA